MSDTELIIDLQSRHVECCVCDTHDEHHWALATYEDVILPDDYEGEWMGNACCRRCYAAWLAGIIQPHMTFAQAHEAVKGWNHADEAKAIDRISRQHARL